MPVEHIVSQSDTLYSIAEEYLGNANRWRELIDYNQLDAPYIVGSREEVVRMTYGSGYLTIQRESISKPVTIPKGWTFRTKPYMFGGMIKVFKTTDEVTVPAGVPVFHVHVCSSVPGDYGNVSAGLITEHGKEFIDNHVQFTRIINMSSFTGGSNRRILTIGDSVYVPSEDDNGLVIPKDVTTMLAIMGGEDLVLEDSVLVEDGFGDIKSVAGMQNIEQAVTHRLMTEKGEYPLHPEYGTGLSALIGRARTPYTVKLAEVDIYESLAYEDRIKDVDIVSVEIEGTSIYVTLNYKASSTARVAYLDLTLNFGTLRG